MQQIYNTSRSIIIYSFEEKKWFEIMEIGKFMHGVCNRVFQLLSVILFYFFFTHFNAIIFLFPKRMMILSAHFIH